MSTNGDSRRVAVTGLRPIPARKVVGSLAAALAVGLAFSGLAFSTLATADSGATPADAGRLSAAPLNLPSSRFPDRGDSPDGLLPPLGEKPAAAAPAGDQIPASRLLVKIPKLEESPRAQFVENPDTAGLENYFQPPAAAVLPDLGPVEAAPAAAAQQEPDLLPAQSAERLLEDDIAAARTDLPIAEAPAEPEPAAQPAQAAEEPAASEPAAPDAVPAAPPAAAPPAAEDAELAAALAETAPPPAEDAAAATAPPPDPLAPPPPPPDLGGEAAAAEEPQAAPETAPDSGQTQMAALPPADDTPEPASLRTRLLFEAGSADLSPESRTLLSALAGKLAQTPETRIQLLAFAEKDPASASAARNLSLSRARMVRGFLIDQGVPATRVLLRPLGDKYKDGPPDRVDVEALRR